MIADEEALRRALSRSAAVASGAHADELAMADELAASHKRAPQAAVSVVLAGPRLEVLLIRRALNPRDPWSGHMALPGGHRDPVDANLLETARRETREETAVELGGAHLWGPMAPLSTMGPSKRVGPGRRSVLPVVFRLQQLPTATPNHEVAEIVWCPLNELATEDRACDAWREHEGRRYRFPGWDLGNGRVVWGLTHRILSDLLALAGGPKYTKE